MNLIPAGSLDDGFLASIRSEEMHTGPDCDLMSDGKDGTPVEPADMQSHSVDQIVYQKVCLELLEKLFDKLSEQDKSTLGLFFGAYGYEKYSPDALGLKNF